MDSSDGVTSKFMPRHANYDIDPLTITFKSVAEDQVYYKK